MRSRTPIPACIALICFAWMLPLASLHAQDAPGFSLTDWNSERTISLDDFRGRIVVLDFFSPTCGTCFRVSRDLHVGIQRFYAARSGNSAGIAVQVLALNTEPAKPAELELFIQETGISVVLDDTDGSTLLRYGGNSVPYVAVVDLTDAAAPQVVYRAAGFESIAKLRQVVDSVDGQPAAKTDTATAGPAGMAAAATNAPDLSEAANGSDTLKPVETEAKPRYQATLDTAALIADDVQVSETLVEFRRTWPTAEATLALSHRHIRTEYESDCLEVAVRDRLSAERVGIQTSGELGVSERLTLTVEGGIYRGFQNYRTLWLDRYYRHMRDALKKDIPDLGGYEQTDPWGWNAGAGLRWEYLEDAGFVEAALAWQQDVVSPGYELGIPLLRLRERYETVSTRLGFENVLTPRLRTRLEATLDDTTNRELRTTLQGALAYALAEHWVVRLALAGARENPRFESKSVTTVLERDWHSTWFLSLFGRYYEDTSEIGNAMSGTAAAPPLKTYQAGIGLRRQGHHSAFKLVLGPSFSRYDSEPSRNRELDQLYRDRDWLSLQVAYLHRF